MSDHIPDPGQHRTILYGHYANRVRGARQRGEAEPQEASAEPPRRRCSPTWARLIAKVYQADPLVCTRCGQKMQMIAFLTDRLSIRRILDHLGLSTPPQERPPPVREILRVAECGEGWGVPAEVSSTPRVTLAGPRKGSGLPPRTLASDRVGHDPVRRGRGAQS
jgi:hypothetical protein